MARIISQETYDEAVKENIQEFDMTPEEALEETNKQFESQGVDLSHIIKILTMSERHTVHEVTAAVIQLSNLNKAKSAKTPEEYLEQLNIIKRECDKGLEYRVLAGKGGAYNVILDVLRKFEEDNDMTKECLKTLISLMTKQPDLLDAEGIQLIISYLDKQKEPEIQRLLFKWVKECCTMHEMNRQQIFEAAILDHMKPLLQEASSALLRDVLGVLRALVLDDDVRVEFGKSHEHARVIASDMLCAITALLSKFKQDEALMNDIMLTISALLVRNEFCKKVEDAGGLEIIKDVIITFCENDKLIRQCFKVLKAMAGNDECKMQIIQKGCAPVIASALNTHKESLPTATAGLACIAAISLRSPDNSKTFFEAGMPEVILACMKIHTEDISVQRNGSWAIRNMVSRSRYQNKQFLLLGAEAVLQKDLKKFAACEYDIKSALRDLGCKVELKEEWTGKGGMINTQSKK